jgi:hypothetical protein
MCYTYSTYCTIHVTNAICHVVVGSRPGELAPGKGTCPYSILFLLHLFRDVVLAEGVLKCQVEVVALHIQANPAPARDRQVNEVWLPCLNGQHFVEQRRHFNSALCR